MYGSLPFSFFESNLFFFPYLRLALFTIKKITALAPRKSLISHRRISTISSLISLSNHSLSFSRFHFFFAKEVRKSTKLIKQASTKGYIRLSVILFFSYYTIRFYAYVQISFIYIAFLRFNLSGGLARPGKLNRRNAM